MWTDWEQRRKEADEFRQRYPLLARLADKDIFFLRSKPTSDDNSKFVIKVSDRDDCGFVDFCNDALVSLGYEILEFSKEYDGKESPYHYSR